MCLTEPKRSCGQAGQSWSKGRLTLNKREELALQQCQVGDRSTEPDGDSTWLTKAGSPSGYLALWKTLQNARSRRSLAGERGAVPRLVETTSDWVWEVDRKGVYTYASPRSAKCWI